MWLLLLVLVPFFLFRSNDSSPFGMRRMGGGRLEAPHKDREVSSYHGNNRYVREFGKQSKERRHLGSVVEDAGR